MRWDRGFWRKYTKRLWPTNWALRGIPFERQKTATVYYKQQAVGTQRLDLVVDEKMLLELKAAMALTDLFKQQTLSYLKATGLKLGILINFGTRRVDYVRIAN